MLGETIRARLAEAAAAGQDGFIVFFPEVPTVCVPAVVLCQPTRPPPTALARRIVPPEPGWRLAQLRA